MSKAGSTAFADPELSELFDGEPELLAIADAITATTPKRAEESEIRTPRRRRFPSVVPRRTRSLAAAAVLLAVVAVTPALAFSPTLQQLVGLKGSPAPLLEATLTGGITRKPYPRAGGMVTITFTIGELGKAPGTGVPPGSAFSVLFVPKTGHPQQLIGANGTNGRYSATTRVPPGGIASIQIGGFLNVRTGIPTANGGFWIPITNNPYLRHG